MAEQNANEHLGKTRRKRTLARPIPAEGEGHLFTQSWFPICMSSELAVGQIIGTPFLDGRIVIFRGDDGVAQAVSAYCAHLGADLTGGCVIENRLRCPFHHWQYDREGVCVKLGTPDAPPQNALLFQFPTVERYGLIWVFNGEVPLFGLPDMPYPDAELVLQVGVYPQIFPVDPWVICANTPDLQHLRAVHGIKLDDVAINKAIEWNDYGMAYHLSGAMPTGEQLEFNLRITGTTVFSQTGTLNGRWYGYMAGLAMPQPGQTRVYTIEMVRRDEGNPQSTRALLEFLHAFETGILEQDLPIMMGAHFRPGVLSSADKALARFFEYIRSFPRAHPSADFIR